MFGLSEQTQKYVGWGLVATGVGLGAWALMSKDKKKSKSLGGVGGKRRKKKSKSKKSSKRHKALKF
ncbi:MAG: hypothetical protein MJZ30_09505 [Paludibacteraceae bacterium]|nr:hypothetical protein [Paludibacteraceae bacterium]